MIFAIVVAALVVLAERFATGSYPDTTSNCGARGISSDLRREGTCVSGNTRLVVVDENSVLKLETLEAKLVGIHQRQATGGPAGSRTAGDGLLTFDLAITNRTDAPARFTEGQVVLLLGTTYGEDIGVDEGSAGRSFLSQGRAIPPGGTEVGTVTFAVPAEEIAELKKAGNLDFGNFGTPGGEPEAIFNGPEYGVIRTYQ